MRLIIGILACCVLKIAPSESIVIERGRESENYYTIIDPQKEGGGMNIESRDGEDSSEWDIFKDAKSRSLIENDNGKEDLWGKGHLITKISVSIWPIRKH